MLHYHSLENFVDFHSEKHLPALSNKYRLSICSSVKVVMDDLDKGKNNLPLSFSKKKPCTFSIKIQYIYSRTEKLVQICCLRKALTSKCIATFVHKAECFFLHCFSILCKKYFQVININIKSMSYNLVSFTASFLLEAASPAKKSTSAQFQVSPTYCTCKFFFLLGGTKYSIIFSYLQQFSFCHLNSLIFSDGGSSNYDVNQKTNKTI